jgi:hypothetical protein
MSLLEATKTHLQLYLQIQLQLHLQHHLQLQLQVHIFKKFARAGMASEPVISFFVSSHFRCAGRLPLTATLIHM